MTQLQLNPSVLQPAQPAPTPGHSVATPAGIFAGVKRVLAFVTWVLTGFGLIGYLVRRRSGAARSEEIIVYTVHQSFYLWALILTGFVAAPLVRHWPGSADMWGWIYVFVLLYTIVSLLFDVSTTKALLWGGIFLLVWITSKYLEDMKHMSVLTGVFGYLAHQRPELNPGMVSVLSWMLLVPWVLALFHTFCRGRKAFSPNSIEERFVGEGCEIMDRSGLKFRTRYRDLFETFLGLGAGDIEAIDVNQHVVKRWENILFLFFVWKRLDEVLHQRSAVVDNAPSNPVEVQEVRKV